VWAEDPAKASKGNVVFHYPQANGETMNDMATKQTVELSTGAAKKLKLTATFDAGTCAIEVPVEPCGK